MIGLDTLGGFVSDFLPLAGEPSARQPTFDSGAVAGLELDREGDREDRKGVLG